MRAEFQLTDTADSGGVFPARSVSDSDVNTGLSVHPATRDDLPYVLEAFEDGLSPYYGGDHAAHARRLVSTHLSGGEDPRGLLSARQLLLILWWRGTRVGVLNLVFKRQATCKISPLILYPIDNRHQGLGAHLMKAAEDHARTAGARQIYCTVAERNNDALAFFLQFGFVACGHSDGQYKDGETEVLLRRPLHDSVTEEGLASIISVTEILTEREWTPFHRLLQQHVATRVDGADDLWLNSLWSGTMNDATGNPEALTWVFGAKDRLNQHRAAAVGIRKKGDSVKVMPLAAVDIESFRAMVIDLPSLLSGKGRKAYLHIAPNPDEVAALQESGWKFEALLPGAYCDTVVTQQWGCQLGEDVPLKTLRISNKYLDLVLSGEKTLEIRVGYENVKRIRPGDDLRLFSRSQFASCHVEDVRSYRDFIEFLEHEDVGRAVPGMNAEQALAELRRIYPPHKEQLGVFALELKVSTI